MPRRDSSSESDRGSHRRRRDRKRNSSSPDSRGNSESSSDRVKRKTHHSRSRSGSRSRTSRRRSRSRSLSSRSPKRHAHRSRSSSRNRRRSRSGSRSRRRRSTSGSRSKGYRRSKSPSPRAKSYRNKNSSEVPKGGDILKQKVQQAIKAAANASAELREKGLLSDVTPLTTSISDQLKRSQAIDDINAQSFVQQEFISSRQTNKTITPKSEDTFDKDSHMSAIFGLAAPKLGLNANSADASIKKLESWKENPEMLVHESLFVDQTGKQERWLKKLFMMRKKQITSNDDV